MANTCLKSSSQLRVVVWEDVGMCVGAILASAADTGGTLYLKVTDGANSRTLHAQVT